LGNIANCFKLNYSELERLNGNQDKMVIISGINNRRKASYLKNYAGKLYPDNYFVLVNKPAKNNKPAKGLVKGLVKMPFEKIDGLNKYPRQGMHVYFPPVSYRTLPELEVLMDRLRGEGGCPWDRLQNHQSLKPYLIEEAYEVIDAIESGSNESLTEELGDLLLQVVFHAHLAKEKGRFHLSDIIEGVITKIIRRHPHVFGNITTSSVRKVLSNWEQIKKEEGNNKASSCVSTLSPKETHLPALVKALKVQQKASKLGFDWDDIKGALDKLPEEMEELKNAYLEGREDKIEEELGDLLFSIVNCARFLKINPEICLKKSVDKFEKRFAYLEEKVQASGKGFDNHNMEQLDDWWNEVKKFGEKRKK